MDLPEIITLSYFYGASNITDAYLISITIPTIIFSFIGTGIATCYIPVYSSIDTEDKAIKFTNNIINFIFIICSAIVIIVYLFSVPIVKLFASGFEGETLILAVKFTKISILSVYFSGVVYVLSSYLNIKNNYIIPGLRSIPLNLITITSIVVSSVFQDLIYLAVGITLSLAIQMLFLIPSAKKKGYKYKLVFDLNDKQLKK